MANSVKTQEQIVLFENNEIRSVDRNGIRYLSVIDVIKALEVSGRPQKYWNDLKKGNLRDEITRSAIIGSHTSRPIWHSHKLPNAKGVLRSTDCATRENIFRIIQEIPSPKANVFKRWLASVGEQTVQEMADPSKAIKRGVRYYELQGKDPEWIKERLDESKPKRKTYVGDLHVRGIGKNDYGKVTNAMYIKTYGIPVSEDKKRRGLKKSDSLRDNMNQLQLSVTSQTEMLAVKLHEKHSAYGTDELMKCAIEAGEVGAQIRKLIEDKIGTSLTLVG